MKTGEDDMSMTEPVMVELSAESIKRVESSAATFQAMADLTGKQRDRIDELERAVKLGQLEIDRYHLDVMDMKNKLEQVQQEAANAVSQRIAYETFFTLLARQMVEFVPPVPPGNSHRSKPIPEVAPTKERMFLTDGDITGIKNS